VVVGAALLPGLTERGSDPEEGRGAGSRCSERIAAFPSSSRIAVPEGPFGDLALEFQPSPYGGGARGAHLACFVLAKPRDEPRPPSRPLGSPGRRRREHRRSASGCFVGGVVLWGRPRAGAPLLGPSAAWRFDHGAGPFFFGFPGGAGKLVPGAFSPSVYGLIHHHRHSARSHRRRSGGSAAPRNTLTGESAARVAILRGRPCSAALWWIVLSTIRRPIVSRRATQSRPRRGARGATSLPPRELLLPNLQLSPMVAGHSC